MKARVQHRIERQRPDALLFPTLAFLITIAASTVDAAGTSRLVLDRTSPRGEAASDLRFSGVVDLAVNPGFDNARVTILVDGQKVAEGLTSPYHLVVDLGPTAVEHKITVVATSIGGKRVRWTETINRGMLPLGVRVFPVDPVAGVFEAKTTAPAEDPIAVVELWDNGEVVASATQPPYRFTVPPTMLQLGFVQVTARTRSGEEVADFWSASGSVVVEEMQVRTVPIFVSVVDREGNTHDDVDRSLFRILDGKAEGKIIEFGKAFDQPISIALLLDASVSMTYSMQHASRAATEFAEKSLRPGDRCSVTAIQDVPRVKLPLSGDRDAVSKALGALVPAGQTALYDALAFAIRDLRGEKNRRAIVVLTDGGDTSSSWSYDELEKLVREAGIPLYFIAYAGGESDGRDIERLRYLAASTGGFVATGTQRNLASRYEAIEKDLRAQFAITYQVSDFGSSHEWRPLRVVVDSPTLTARTIKGYFTP